MVIRYEIEFKGRALSVTQDISPDGSAVRNNKPKTGRVKIEPNWSGVANTRAERTVLDLPAQARGQQKPRLPPDSTVAAEMPERGRNVESPKPVVGKQSHSPGPGGSGPLTGLVIIFGPVDIATAGRAGRRRRWESESPGPG